MDPYVKYEHDGGSRQWGWTLYGANHAIIAWSYGYNSKTGAKKAFKRTREIMAGLVWEK